MLLVCLLFLQANSSACDTPGKQDGYPYAGYRKKQLIPIGRGSKSPGLRHSVLNRFVVEFWLFCAPGGMGEGKSRACCKLLCNAGMSLQTLGKAGFRLCDQSFKERFGAFFIQAQFG